MANDIGTSNLSDADAVTPSDPTTGRTISDYQIPKPLHSTNFNLSKPEQTKRLTIPIRSTVFSDAVSGLTQFLSNIMTIEPDGNQASVFALNIFSHLAGLVDGENVVARPIWNYLKDVDNFFPTNLIQFRLKSISNDTFNCVTFDGTSEGEETIVVAQPPRFRKSLFDGETVQSITYSYPTSNPHRRIAKDSNDKSIVEEIIARYTTDDLIYAMPVSGGLPEDSKFLALNVDGRSWAKIEDVDE